MENFTKKDLSDAFAAGATRMYHDLNLGNGNPPEFEQWFEKFSLYKDHPSTSSGSVAAPKELNEDQKLVHEVHEAHDLAGNAIDKLFDRLSSLKELVREREEALKELLTIAERKFNGISIDDAASHREYIALKAIIERARKLLSK